MELRAAELYTDGHTQTHLLLLFYNNIFYEFIFYVFYFCNTIRPKDNTVLLFIIYINIVIIITNILLS